MTGRLFPETECESHPSRASAYPGLTVLDDVALVMHLGALRQKALASFGATTRKDGTTALGGHAGAETELALTAALGRLICSLAHDVFSLL